MPGLDREKLRKELIAVYSAYAKDPTDAEMKKAARKLHQEHGDSGNEVDRYMAVAVSFIANIGWEAVQPKPARGEVENLVLSLATRKA